MKIWISREREDKTTLVEKKDMERESKKIKEKGRAGKGKERKISEEKKRELSGKGRKV